jgi:hypothetical protein
MQEKNFVFILHEASTLLNFLKTMSKANRFTCKPKTLTVFWFCLIVFSCTYHDFTDNHPDNVLKKAASKCGQPVSNMQWLESLLLKSQTDFSLKGNIYAIRLNERVIFVNQPIIMSCMACLIYDCSGNRINLATVDIQKIIGQMNSSTLIYEPSFD